MAIRCWIADVVSADAGAGAAKERVRSIRTLACSVETEQARAAADDVILAEPAVDEVVATVALDVVVAVRPCLWHVEVKRITGVRIRRNLSIIDEDDLPGHRCIVVVIGANE